ncbi:Vacuolar protein sorting-associated protein 20 [Nowakowskiella sp. JEL0078]|nr:Vacuolar protein sorting-associated protein 20 [Nowakowskiella sp. JEL0078]
MGQKASRVSPKDKAILDLKVQRDKLKNYKKKIVTIMDREKEIAKAHYKAGDKQRALLALKKKKYQEQLLTQTENQLFNLEQLTSSIEYTAIEQEVLLGLKAGNDVLAKLHKEMSLNDVEKLMDDTADAIQYQKEIDDLISGALGLTEEEMGDIEDELNKLVELEADTQKLEMPNVPVETSSIEDISVEEDEEKVARRKEKGKQRAEDVIAA